MILIVFSKKLFLLHLFPSSFSQTYCLLRSRVLLPQKILSIWWMQTLPSGSFFSKAILIYVALKTASKQLADQTSTFFSSSSSYIPEALCNEIKLEIRESRFNWIKPSPGKNYFWIKNPSLVENFDDALAQREIIFSIFISSFFIPVQVPTPESRF